MQDSHMEEKVTSELTEFIEPITDPKNIRLTILPITPEYQILWDIYEKQLECFWKPQEINFENDYKHFMELNDDEKHFVKMVLAFFAASDGIVNFNLRDRFLTEITIAEAQAAYSFQLAMETIHGKVYSDMLNNIVKDSAERDLLFNAIKVIPSVKNMADWAFKWISSKDSIGHRIIAFAIVEGVFFSGAFASIFWLKKTRSENKLFMEGLVKSNRFISRDEGLHTNFACALYKFIVKRVKQSEVHEIFDDAVKVSLDFCTDAIRVDMIGMNLEMMAEYVKYVADRLMVSLGYEKLYNAKNSLDFMETIGLDNKDNFFEQTRGDAYQTAYNDTNANWEFKIDYDSLK